MKSSINNPSDKTPKPKLPALYRSVHDELIVMFTSVFEGKGDGFVVRGNVDFDIGETITEWKMKDFAPFVGVLSLENEYY